MCASKWLKMLVPEYKISEPERENVNHVCSGCSGHGFLSLMEKIIVFDYKHDQ
jgi:hypothetical protein